MNPDAWSGDALLLASSVLVLGLPFVPAWREWRRPGDAAPLPIRGRDAASASPAARPGLGDTGALYVADDFQVSAGSRVRAIVSARSLRLGPGCEVLECAQAQGLLRLDADCTVLGGLWSATAIQLAAGCCFARVEAPLVRFGLPLAWLHLPSSAPPQPADCAALPGARRRSPALVRVDGPCVLAARRDYAGSLVVHGGLRIARGAVLQGGLKASGDVVLESDAQVQGAVIADRSVRLHAGARVGGPLVAAADILLGPGACVGRGDAPTTLGAARIFAESGALAHGLVAARRVGLVWGTA